MGTYPYKLWYEFRSGATSVQRPAIIETEARKTETRNLIFAYAEATVPKVAVIIRKAYGGAYIVMSSKHLRSDVNLVWPSGEIAVMGAEGAINIIYREQISKSGNPDETRKALITEYQEKFTNPYVSANRGYVDDVIDPADTRARIINALEAFRNKRDSLPAKKHGNIPL
jgi:propionyl-CoA carboxylase beta chain